MASNLHLRSVRLKNFKAILDSGRVQFTPLTAFIGNNGAGKSSLIEGLETFQTIVVNRLDVAMQHWKGIEYIWHQEALAKAKPQPEKYEIEIPDLPRTWLSNPIEFLFGAVVNQQQLRVDYEISARNKNLDFVGFKREEIVKVGKIRKTNSDSQPEAKFLWMVHNWQFLELAPANMGLPRPRQRASSQVRLAKDGSNVAEYLLSIRELDAQAFEGIVETLMYVLPYAKNIQPSITSELERTVYLQLTEKEFKVPGWLLSSGTLRVLALLCVLRHPTPPPLIVIEELENGLDPRTVQLILDEIRYLTTSGKSQVIFTTHSPYLLDLLRFNEIVLVERVDGAPQFFRPDPSNNQTLQRWTEKFNPGQLYTMGQLRAGEA